jgi:periplasmic mercuric ion binding protein
MKTNFIILLFIAVASTAFAQTAAPTDAAKTTTANIKVFGNCGMCKERIEKSLDTKGVKQAKWNVATKNLEIIYVPGKITEKKIRELVSEAGHDTDSTKAKDVVYAKLPFCCLYRDHDHSGMDDNKKKDH